MNKGFRSFLIGLGTTAVVVLVGWAALRQAPPPATLPPTIPTTTASRVRTDTDLKVPRVSLEEVRQRIEAGTVTLIDVRDADSYIAAHIPGAIQIPLARIEGEVNYLPRDKPIVTYCT